jgi:hypothetical protein
MKYLFVTGVLLALSSGEILLAADTVPAFKIESCRAAEESGSVSRNAQACFQDEQNAKDTLKQNWTTYDSGQKGHCQRLLKAGGRPSYVELLTCLEMKTGPRTTPTGNTRNKKGVRAISGIDCA